MAVEKLLLKPEEAAEILSIGRSKFYELMGTAELASVRIRACRRIPAEALSDFVAGLRDTSPAVESTATAIG